MTTYVLGGGCFWCLDAVFRQLRGVKKVESGYTGGTVTSPNYYQVATGQTGHAEVVRVMFDESIIPAETILAIYFVIHDPTTLDRQGADVGTQYRSVMLYADERQKREFSLALKHAQTIWDNPIVTDLRPLETFYLAESEHQDYFRKNPDAGYCQIIIAPKVIKARRAYKQWFKED
jgi:peptide-methionine (S)-S-oxide reductase